MIHGRRALLHDFKNIWKHSIDDTIQSKALTI